MPNPTLITDAEITGLLKNFYTEFREKVQNIVTPFVAQLNKAKAGGARNVRWGGNGTYWDVVVGRPAGASTSVGGFFPPDTTATERQANAGVVRAYTTRQIDGLAFLGTQSKQMAFTSILSKTMEEIKDASRLLMQQAFHNKADGVVATIASRTSDTVYVVQNPYGLANSGQAGLLLSIGDMLAIRDVTGATLRTGKAQITNMVPIAGTDTATMTLGGVGIAAVVATDVIVKATASDDSFGNAMNGLISITNRGAAYNSLHNISAASFGIWDAVRMVAGVDTPDSTQPTESDIWDLIQRINGRSGKDANTRPTDFLLMTTPGVRKKLMDSLVGQRRFTAGEFATTIKGGYNAISICGIPCVDDYYVPAGTIYLIHLPSLGLVDAKDWSFVEFEGAGPWRWVQGRDAFETTYGFVGNLITLARNAHGSITGFVDTARYSHVV